MAIISSIGKREMIVRISVRLSVEFLSLITIQRQTLRT